MNNIAHECNSKHPSTYDLLKEMRTQGILVIYIGFAKEAIFHILFECAITVYTIELVAILTKFFIKDIAEIPNPLLFVFSPSILVVPVTFLFILLFIKQFLIWVQPYSKSTEENIIKDLLLNQGTLVEILKIIHLFGAGFYIGLTASISAFFCCRYADNISNKTEFIMAVVFIGIVFGIIWNITGYYRDKRYFLAKFIDRFPQSSAREKDELFRLTWNNIKGNIVSIISLFLISAVIILFANDSLLKSETLLQLTTEYNFVTVLYVMLIAIYLRNGYKLLYPQTQDDADLFPSITFMLDMKSKRSIKHTSQEAHTK